MLLGIDVGGTFTDAVVIADHGVVCMAKKPTNHANLLEGILEVIDEAVRETGCKFFSRIALSTTIVTNALVENRTDTVGLAILPGPGMDITQLVPVAPYILTGSIDHRGREISSPDRQQVEGFLRNFPQQTVFAVSGKFSIRNPEQELSVAKWLGQEAKPEHISLGAGVSGNLNFVRRTNSAYYNAAVWRQFNRFADSAEAALAARGITAPVYILKADGGTMPLAAARDFPVETIFTGPAASVLGIMAMVEKNIPAVSLDIGGTTTDIALWQAGRPLFASRGAGVCGYHTAVRSFYVKSVGVGGDSYVRLENGELQVGPMRAGIAMAAGGGSPTLSDAMIAAGISHFGNKQLALAAMQRIDTAKSPEETARLVLETAAGIIMTAIDKMLEEQAAEPVYRVNDMIRGTALKPQLVIGVGGAAGGLVPLIAQKSGMDYYIPKEAQVANAIGAAVARPTVDITFRADTAQGFFTVAELGVKEKLASRTLKLPEAKALAEEYLKERALAQGIEAKEMEEVSTEEFNVVQGFRTLGKIITCRMQIKPGVLYSIGEEQV